MRKETLTREEYIEQMKSITKDSIPDRRFQKPRYFLVSKFQGSLPKNTQPEYKQFNLELEHVKAKGVESVYKEYNELAIHYANLYRGGYLLNYYGFALAVTVAAIAMSVLYYSKYIPSEFSWISEIVLVCLGALKLFIIYFIIQNTHDLQRNRINQKYIDFRYVAERLRFDVVYGVLGKSCPLTPKLGHHLESDLKNSTGEILYQHVRASSLLNLPSGVGSNIEQTAVSYLPEDQKNFHSNRAVRHEGFEKFLQKRTERMNTWVIRLVVFDLIVALSFLLCHACHWDVPMIHWLHKLTAILIACTVILPAWVAAHVAITAQSEYGRLAVRNERLRDELNETIQELKNNYKQSLFDETAQKLLDEVTEWTLIYEKKVHEM